MGFPVVSGAQSLLDRSPNVSGDWTGAPGTVYSHFVHRFTASDAPERKVSNVPTFLLAAGLPKRFMAGFNYSTNSSLAPRFPNEWELFARWLPVSQDFGAPLDLGGQVGYNNASDGVDAEISAARRVGIVRVIAAGRALSGVEGSTRFAVAGGATLRLNQYVALAGDIGSLVDRDSAERVAWSAGLHFAIPLTPHTVSLHATNAMITTLQGASRGTSDVRYGFEFTIPLTLRRYFGKRASAEEPVDSVPPLTIAPVVTPAPAIRDTIPEVQAPPPQSIPAPVAPVVQDTAKAPAPRKPPARVVKTGIRNVSYLQPRLQVTVGTTIEWTNNDPMPHSVTATDRSFNSGLINPGKTYRHTFTKAGTFSFFCMPHPFMKGTVVVRAQ
jgi:plastocyanin